MFGHKDIETTAIVVAITDTTSRVEVNGKYQFQVVLDVKATDGPAFRITTEHRFDPLFSPNPGDVVRVSYDPKSHKTKIDTDGDARYDIREHEKQRHKEGDAAVAAAMAQPAGTSLTPDPFEGAQYDPELTELVELERQQLAEQQLSPPTTPSPPVPPPSVMPSALVPPTWTTASVPPTVPQPGAPARLQHLQMLRDSGLLTPEEFEILKTHLPAGS
jgi:hypothetical protein